jgi:hypothetical protein
LRVRYYLDCWHSFRHSVHFFHSISLSYIRLPYAIYLLSPSVSPCVCCFTHQILCLGGASLALSKCNALRHFF